MADGLKTLRLEAGYLGIENDAAPSVIGKGKARGIYNYLTGDKGRLRQRGAITAAVITYAAARTISGVVWGNDRLLIGLSERNTATRNIEPWVAPYKPSLNTALATAVYSGSPSGTIEGAIVSLVTNAVTNADPDMLRTWSVGPANTRYGKFAYYIAYDSIDDALGYGSIRANDRGGYERDTRLCRWDTTLDTDPPGTSFYVYSPKAAQDVRVHYGRMMVLGGSKPDNSITPIRHMRLWYSQQLDPSDFSMGFSPRRNTSTPALRDVGNVALDDTGGDAWTDEITGVYNFIDIPGPQSDFGVKMAAVGRNLAILCRERVVLLTGYGPSTWQIRTIAENVGCIDPRSVVEVGEGCFFLSKQGFMFFDGQQIVDVSRGIHRLLLEPALAAVGDSGTPGGFAVGTRLNNDYLMLTVGLAQFSTSSATRIPRVTFCGLYHIPSNSWANFTSSLFNDTAPYYIGRTETKVWLADDEDLYVANEISTPETVAAASRGKDGTSNIYTLWTSRVAELAAPGNKSRLHRVTIDYEWAVDGDFGDETYTGPTVNIRDATTGTVLDTYTLPSHKDEPATFPEIATPVWRKRHVREVFVEANEIQVEVEYNSTARALARSAVHDVWIEYEVAQERAGSSNA